MSMMLSFLGGAARQLTTDIEKSEEDAREDAKLGFSALYKRYEENTKSNRELESKMAEDNQWISTNYPSATDEQKMALIGNPVALEALKKTDDPYKIDLNNYVKIVQGNQSPAVQAERIQALPSLVGQIKESMSDKVQLPKEGRSPLGGFVKEFGESSYESTMGRLAKSQGMSIADLQATSRAKRKDTGAQFDMSTLEKAPGSVEEMVKTANVARVQAKQKFGEDSPEYKAASQAYTEISKEIDKTDKGLQARADRLNIAVMDEQDPITKKALQSELKSTQQAIKDHKEATSTRAEREAGNADKTTLSKLRSSVAMFVDSRMRQDKGFDWAKHVDFKEIPLPDGGVYVSTSVKTTLPPEKQREVFEKIRMLEADALKTNGYIVGGAPRNEAVKEFISNKNIPAEYYSGKTPAAPSVNIDQARADANAAIAKGANRAAVAARFKQTTGQEL